MLKSLAINDNNSICFAVHKSNSLNCNLVSKIGNFMRSMSCPKNEKFFMKGACLTSGLCCILLFNKMKGLFA